MLLVLVLCIAGVLGDYPYPYPAAVSQEDDNSRPLEIHSPQAAPPRPETVPAPETIVLKKNSRISLQDERNQYTHGFNDGDTSVSEQGRLLSTNDGWEYVLVKKGSYSYISPEGVPVTVDYVADQNGYRVLGQSIG